MSVLIQWTFMEIRLKDTTTQVHSLVIRKPAITLHIAKYQGSELGTLEAQVMGLGVHTCLEQVLHQCGLIWALEDD